MEGNIILTMYKSERKNAKGTMKTLYIPVGSSRDIDHLISIIDWAVNVAKTEYNGRLIATVSIDFIAPNTEYKDANGKMYNDPTHVYAYYPRARFYSIESFIGCIYCHYLTMKPGSKLHKKTVFENPSIKYIINKYYS